MKIKTRTLRFDAFIFLFVAALGLPLTVLAADPISIVSYDVEQTPDSGWGGWSHKYSGAITDTGRTLLGGKILNYTGGGGTLNDDIISLDVNGTHLFTTTNDDGGRPISPQITLYLDGTYLVEKIRVYGGNVSSNAIPGAITGATIEVGGTSETLSSTDIGDLNPIQIPFDDLFDLTATPLAGIPTDRIILKNFSSSLFDNPFDQFSITEITVEGTVGLSPVNIDVVPANSLNHIQIKSHQRVPVAILSDAQFNAPATVDIASLTFGEKGDEKTFAFCQNNPRDVNGDRRDDLVCFFSVDKAGFHNGDIKGVLKGRTTAGVQFKGEDFVCLGSCPSKQKPSP